MKKIQISPSILSADFSQLGNEIKRLEEGGADMIHVDIDWTGCNEYLPKRGLSVFFYESICQVYQSITKNI